MSALLSSADGGDGGHCCICDVCHSFIDDVVLCDFHADHYEHVDGKWRRLHRGIS